jgi:hypothetical protein
VTDDAGKDLNHITFRPGEELRARLASGRLSTGAKAKRDLLRYYDLLDAEFDRWWERRKVDEDQWFFITQFVQSRSWRVLPPAGRDFIHDFEAFMEGVQQIGYPKGTKALALSKVADLSAVELLAVIDHAQDEVTARGAATAGATSAAS